MSAKISEQGSVNPFKEYVMQKRWVAIALLITSVVIFGGLATIGGLSLFSQALNTIGHGGAWAAFMGGGVTAILGTIISIVLLVNKGRSSLHRAIENKADANPFLLGEKEINASDHNGNRPLHYAVLNGHALSLLLAESVDLNAKNHYGHTPLDVAVRAGQGRSVVRLLEQPAVTIDMATIIWAISNDLENIAEILLTNEKYKGPWDKCLFKAIEEGQKKVVEAILKKYADPNHPDLHEAFVLAANHHRGDYWILLHLLDKGVSVNAKSRQYWGRTALHQAANRKDIDLIYFLLKADLIDVNVEDDYGKSPLELAMEWPWLEVAILLIESKKVSAKNLDIARAKAAITTQDCSRLLKAINEYLATRELD